MGTKLADAHTKRPLLSYISCKMQTVYEEAFAVNGVTQAGEALKLSKAKRSPLLNLDLYICCSKSANTGK